MVSIGVWDQSLYITGLGRLSKVLMCSLYLLELMTIVNTLRAQKVNKPLIFSA